MLFMASIYENYFANVGRWQCMMSMSLGQTKRGGENEMKRGVSRRLRATNRMVSYRGGAHDSVATPSTRYLVLQTIRNGGGGVNAKAKPEKNIICEPPSAKRGGGG